MLRDRISHALDDTFTTHGIIDGRIRDVYENSPDDHQAAGYAEYAGQVILRVTRLMGLDSLVD
jgi:hypothetical protein